MAHRQVVVARHKARVAVITVTVQAVMIVRQAVVVAPSDVMIVRQAVAVAQQANPPMENIVKRGQPVVAVLKAAVAQTVIPAQIVIVLQDVMSVQIVMAALKGAKIKLAQLAAGNRLLVIS